MEIFIASIVGGVIGGCIVAAFQPTARETVSEYMRGLAKRRWKCGGKK